MDDNIYKIAFVEDMIFDLCVNKTMLLYPQKYITSEDADWFRVKLSGALLAVREQICFLLAEGDAVGGDILCFTLFKRYKLHSLSLPVKIETAIVDTICGWWLAEHGVDDGGMAALAQLELKSMALRQDRGYSRKNNI